MSFELIFRPDDGYFLTTPTGWQWSANLPANVSTRLLKTKKDEPDLVKLYYVALSPDGGYFISWKDAEGATWTDHTLSASHPDLVSWIKTNNNTGYEADNYKVFLGPGGQFFARGNKGETQGLKWAKVPTALEATIPEMMSNGAWKDGQTPSSVTIGVDNAFVILCNGGSRIKWSGNIAEVYPTFHKEVLEKFKEGRSYEFLALNPYKRDQHFAVWDDGSSGWKLPTALSKIVQEEATKFVDLRAAESTASLVAAQAREARSIALLNQATRLADAGMRRAMRSSEAMGCIGTGYHYEYYDEFGNRTY
ncbi:hypothetical protein B0J14DRAFT_668649 [Halenospora varia]|nr:hypothetical protein B0J14DRAFT_668649 [Halenospora varia]